jgi:hypothetical protein
VVLCLLYSSYEEEYLKRGGNMGLISLLVFLTVGAVHADGVLQNNINVAECVRALHEVGPEVIPDRPKTRPGTQPSEDPRPVTVPRHAPNPLPERPLEPTFDPKDIIPADLYGKDEGMKHFWDSLDSNIKKTLLETDKKYSAELVQKFSEKYKTAPNLPLMVENYLRIQAQLKSIEGQHQIAMERLVRHLAEDRFGASTMSVLKSGISSEMPSREVEEAKSISQESTKNDISQKQMDFYVYRRELYNLLNQAEGWNGMQEFIKVGKFQMDEIDPRLAPLYEEMDLNFRLAQRLSLSAIPDVNLLQVAEKDQLSMGREIVCINCKPAQSPTGQKQIEISSVSGVAVGANAWALAHEVYKASFQIGTALESTQRSPLNGRERRVIEDSTNSNVAEIRQGIFGHAFQVKLQSFIASITGSTSSHVYMTVVERVFSLLPEQSFKNFINDSFNFDPAKSDIKTLRAKYGQYLLLDEFRQ